MDAVAEACSPHESMATNPAKDLALMLADDLPPQAYTDPGFLQFLKTQASESSAPQPAERPET